MLCNITQNSMGQTPGGGTLPGQDGGVPCQGGTQVGYPPGARTGGYPARGYPGWVPPGRVPPLGQDGGMLLGGTLPGYPPTRSGWGDTQLGQQKEYSLHGGRYASCVHAGGLSCFLEDFQGKLQIYGFIFRKFRNSR